MNKKILVCVALLSASFKTNSMQPRMRMLQLARSTRHFNSARKPNHAQPEDRDTPIHVDAGIAIGGILGGCYGAYDEFTQKHDSKIELAAWLLIKVPTYTLGGVYLGGLSAYLILPYAAITATFAIPTGAVYYGKKYVEARNKSVESKKE